MRLDLAAPVLLNSPLTKRRIPYDTTHHIAIKPIRFRSHPAGPEIGNERLHAVGSRTSISFQCPDRSIRQDPSPSLDLRVGSVRRATTYSDR